MNIFTHALSLFLMGNIKMSDSQKQPYLQIRNVRKTFRNFVALDDISLDIFPGEFVCFLGPSGCGKTTLLRCVAGLEEQDSGGIIQAGRDVSRLAPSQRDFGIVFQSYALFPNLTATRNIAYGLENMKLPRPQIRARVQELLELVGLSESASKYPAQLSGGQQQRVALARALALSPGLLLLDEPLSALDARVRAGLRTELALLQRRIGVTTIMVTHDQEEALTLADRIVVMDQGTIQQIGTPQEIYRMPRTPFVANFIGEMNFLEGVVAGRGEVRCGHHHLRVSRLNGTALGSAVRLAIRPEDIVIPFAATTAENTLSAKLQHSEFLGAFYRLRLRVDDLIFLLDMPMTQARNIDFAHGVPLTIHLPADFLHVYPS
jgi:iron(III) transport system ATP-binding protein